MEGALYGGQFEIVERNQGFNNEVAAVAKVSVLQAFGGQLWLETPVEGLRLGVGALRWQVDEESQFNPVEATWSSWYVSLDADFERWVARAEYRNLELPADVFPFLNSEAIIDLYYWQLGWLPTSRLAIYVQSEYADIEQRVPIFVGGGFKFNNRRDDGVSVRYNFGKRQFVVRGEYHRQRLDQVSVIPIFTPEGLAFQASTEEFASEYVIVSFSFSF